MTLCCNPQITIISAHAPIESAQLVSKDSFYDELHSAICLISVHNFVIVLGDLNACNGKISHESPLQIIGRYSYHQNTNNNSKLLINLCENSKLIFVFHCQLHTKKLMLTWEQSDGVHRAQDDDILMK